MGTEVDAKTEARLLLIDTCGEVASVALAEGLRVVACERLARRRASAEIVEAVAQVLRTAGWTMQELVGVGVVSGPGSFTGVRTGLAVAKGLCEAASLPLVAVSRLAVLLDASGGSGFAVLDAGRGEVYVRDASDGRESLMPDAELLEIVQGKGVAIVESTIEARLASVSTTLVTLDAGVALPLLLKHFERDAGDAALLDAHYLRDEGNIYAKPMAAGGAR